MRRCGVVRSLSEFSLAELGQKLAAWGYNPARLPIRLDRDSVGVGDTLGVRFISPFTRGEAWVTVEREEILAQRRVRVARGESVVGLRAVDCPATGASWQPQGRLFMVGSFVLIAQAPFHWFLK